jgi:hypothetical protein
VSAGLLKFPDTIVPRPALRVPPQRPHYCCRRRCLAAALVS